MAKKEIKTIEFEDSCNLCGGKSSNCESCCGAEPKIISPQGHELLFMADSNEGKDVFVDCTCGKTIGIHGRLQQSSKRDVE